MFNKIKKRRKQKFTHILHATESCPLPSVFQLEGVSEI